MQLLTVEEAAKVLRVSMFTVRKLLREGKLPGVKVGGVWRVREADLDAFLAGKSSGRAPVAPAATQGEMASAGGDERA